MERVVNFFHKTNRWHRVGVLFAIAELRLIPSGQYGFTCNDPALSYPFNGDTISWKWLLATVMLFPFAFLLIAERLLSQEKSNKWKKQALRWYKEYVFGVMLNLTVIGILKDIVTSPRPHFFDTCRPLEATTCVGSEFVSSYTCTSSFWISQSDKSFPSGHSSLGVHTAIFLAFYLQKRFNARNMEIRAMQVILIVAGVFCAWSRMWDHRHHWWDVLGGSILALPILYYTIFNLCDNFNCKQTNVEQSTTKDVSTNGIETKQNNTTPNDVNL